MTDRQEPRLDPRVHRRTVHINRIRMQLGSGSGDRTQAMADAVAAELARRLCVPGPATGGDSGFVDAVASATAARVAAELARRGTP